MPRSHFVLAICAAALVLPASAQNIKPGIWEVSNNIADPSGNVSTAMGMLQRQLETMAPEQRLRVEQMMAQNGVQLNPSGGVLAKVCVTPEMAKNNDVPVSQNGNCSQSHSPMKSGRMSFTFNCPGAQTSGSGELRLVSDTNYVMTANILRGGSPAPITVDSNARWLGADCGTVKPLALPR